MRKNLLDRRYIHWERKDFYGIVKPESLAAWIADKPIRSEAAEAVLEAAVQSLALELEDGGGIGAMRTKGKLLICGLIFCVRRGLESLFSTAVHGLLTRKITWLSLLPIGDCLASLFSNRQHMMLYLCLQGFVCVLAVMFFLTNMRPYESDLNTITPEIKTPKAVGQYQHGSARWMSDAEKEKSL